MKKLLTILAAGGLMAAATVQAQVDIYITGSTAFRANSYRSIRAIYGANLTSQNPAHDASAQNQVTFQGTIPSLFGGQTVTIRTGHNGSAAGIQTVAQNLSINFRTSATAGDTNMMSHQADLAFSDVFQTTTTFPTPVLVDTNVGVVVFAWVKSSQTPAGVTNITIQQCQRVAVWRFFHRKSRGQHDARLPGRPRLRLRDPHHSGARRAVCRWRIELDD